MKTTRQALTRWVATPTPDTPHFPPGGGCQRVLVTHRRASGCEPHPQPGLLVTTGLSFEGIRPPKPISHTFRSVSCFLFYWNNCNFLAGILTYIKPLGDNFAVKVGRGSPDGVSVLPRALPFVSTFPHGLADSPSFSTSCFYFFLSCHLL